MDGVDASTGAPASARGSSFAPAASLPPPVLVGAASRPGWVVGAGDEGLGAIVVGDGFGFDEGDPDGRGAGRGA
jgi:hypothetical protein